MSGNQSTNPDGEAAHTWACKSDAVMISVKHHGMQSQRKDLEKLAAAVLHRNRVVDQGEILLLHHPSKILHFTQHRSKCQGFLLQTWSIEPNHSMYLQAFPADQRERRIGPPLRRFRGWIGALQVIIVQVEGELRVKIVGSNNRPRTLGFASADVQTAERVPDHTPNVRLDWPQPILGAIAVQSHAFGNPDGGSAKNRMRTRDLTPTERYL